MRVLRQGAQSESAAISGSDLTTGMILIFYMYIYSRYILDIFYVYTNF